MFRRSRKSDTEAADLAEASSARFEAEVDLKHRHAETNRVRAVLAEWRGIREQNNIAKAFEASLRGERP